MEKPDLKTHTVVGVAQQMTSYISHLNVFNCTNVTVMMHALYKQHL